jgi:hypothetical protein
VAKLAPAHLPPRLVLVTSPAAGAPAIAEEAWPDDGDRADPAGSAAEEAVSPSLDPRGIFDTFDPFIAGAHPRRGNVAARSLIYVGIAVVVALLVFVILNVIESRDLAPRIIPAP